MSEEISIRYAGPADVRTLVDFRTAMFRDMGWQDEDRLSQVAVRYAEYVRDASARGDFVSWIAEHRDEVVGGAALLWERVPPTVRNISGQQAYILSIYVRPAWRRQGIAGRLVSTVVSYARENGAEVISLHYSPAGKGLYEKHGFAAAPEMRLFTDPTAAAWSPHAPAHTPADDAD